MIDHIADRPSSPSDRVVVVRSRQSHLIAASPHTANQTIATAAVGSTFVVIIVNPLVVAGVRGGDIHDDQLAKYEK